MYTSTDLWAAVQSPGVQVDEKCMKQPVDHAPMSQVE